ncbi:MAG: 3-deoxy-manno-octulosonate cytidylyltransferase, partial [Planctomycetota bacterium]
MNTTRSHDRSVIVIPARLGSTRLPRKMLLRDTGKTLVQHTWEVACASAQADRVIIATDSDEILCEVERFGGKAVLTDPAATSGTERIVELLPHFPDADVIVNLQGDEPELDPHAINLLIDLL